MKTSMNTTPRRLTHYVKQYLALLLSVCLTFAPGLRLSHAATPPNVTLSDVPMVLVTPAHPQVLLAVGNSQSMDGDLGGAIMTGSGTVTALNNSSSPVNYTVPTGFTAPVSGTTSGNPAPYTVNQSGTLYDNSASRLNVAKAAIQAILNSYASTTDFGLMDYSTSGTPGLYDTWVYYMSQTGGFTFTSTAGSNTYPNPCYQNSSDSNCTALKSFYGSAAGVISDPYLVAQISSDDPSINDVLYAGGLPDVFISYNGPNPSSPYPPNFSLTDYNNGSIFIGYNSTKPNIGGFGTSPTNAGYVPYSDQVLYAQRGFGYYNNVSANTGKLLVSISTANPNNISGYIAQFTPYLAPETNDPSTTEIKANAIQSPIAGLLKKAYNYYVNTPPPSSNGCTTQQYVVLMTDGLPTLDLSGYAWPPLGSASASGYGVSATFNADGSLNTTNDQALTDTISQISALNAKGIKTYVIGMGAGVDPNKNPQAANTLKAMAVAGGTSNYFPATSAADVSNDLQVILSKIQAASMTTTAAAVNSTGLNTTTTVYQGKFNSSDTYGDWTGNLLAFPVDSQGNVNTNPSNATWQAQPLLDSLNWNTNRVIATFNPATGKGIPFRWSSLNATQQSQLTAASDPSGSPLPQERLHYLRGDTSNEQRNGGPFRNRTHILGDIVDSNPVYIGAPLGAYTDTSYFNFQTTYKNRTPVIYVGADDGMLHAFNANTGQELFAFVPDGVFNDLINLTQPTYNTAHKFYVDGSPTAGDVQFSDGSWHTILVGGLNNGGNTIYALDVTDPSTITSETSLASHVLWEYSSASGDLGRTYSRPAIARIACTGSAPCVNGSRFVVIFGSGYNNADGNPYLYVVDAQTGALIKKLNMCSGSNASNCSATLPNGLSSPVAVSKSGNGLADTIYAGDLQGNMWVVDLSKTNPVQWSNSLLFKAVDSGGTPQPITTTPVVSLHPLFPAKTGVMVYFGTGQFLGAPDITNTKTQSFYGVWDNNWSSQTTRADLVQQTLNQTTVGAVTVRTVSSNPVDWNTKRGWFIDLPLAGERVITDPRLANGRVIFTTYVPTANSCSGGGQSWLMVLNYLNGSAFPQPEIDLNSDGKLNAQDQTSTGENPVGVYLGDVYATAPTIINTRQGDIGEIKLITKSDGTIQTIKERGGAQGRVSWKQIE